MTRRTTQRCRPLLDEIIADRKRKALDYEQYLLRIALLATKVEAGRTTILLFNSIRRDAELLYNNLKSFVENRPASRVADSSSKDPALDLAMHVDAQVRLVRPDGWRGVQAREQVIKAALYNVLQDVDEVERIFTIIKRQREY